MRPVVSMFGFQLAGSFSGVGLMCHQIKNDVDAERIATLFGKIMEEPVVFALAFPGIAVVAIVRGDDHDMSLVVEDGADVHFAAILLVAVLVTMICFPSEVRGTTTGGDRHGRRLQFIFGNLDVEHAMKNRS